MKSDKSKVPFRQHFNYSDSVRWLILGCVTVVLTALLYPELISPQREYKLGDVAERDIKAVREFHIEDQAATASKRRQTMDAVLTVYDHDDTLLSKLDQRIQSAFTHMRAIIEAPNTQRAAMGYITPGEPTLLTPQQSVQPARTEPPAQASQNLDQLWENKPDFEEKLGLEVSDGAFRLLLKEAFAEDIQVLILRILGEILENGVVANKEILLRETEKGIILREVSTQEEIEVNALKHYYGLDQAKTMVRIIGHPLLKDHNYTLRNLIVDFVQRLLQPNITLNRHETESRRNTAVDTIKPIFNKIKAGEMILREGERVTELQLAKLKVMQDQTGNDHPVASVVGAAFLICTLLLIVYFLHMERPGFSELYQNKNLLLMASVLIAFVLLAKITITFSEGMITSTDFAIPSSAKAYGIPLAAGVMTICLFMGLSIAIPFALVLAACTAIVLQNRFDLFLYFLLNGTMSAFWMRNCRERRVFIKAGIKLGILNVLLVTTLDAYLTSFTGYRLVWDWGFAFLGGVGAGIVTAGMAPLIELTFGYSTDIKLLEVSNLDQPILRKLMIEAPGTYHHSVIVGSLAEAAAAEIGANALLAKVCGYYHDIGKSKKPLYFIENQSDGINKHDKLAPSMSRAILIAHVKDGVEMARKHKLAQPIIDTIQQSHGTSLISYFYEKARQLKGKDAVNPDDYRYPGPKPQTREAALVMLADVVEAASRTLDNPTPARIQGVVQNLINKVFSDGQLDECDLTLKDLHKIAKHFNKILSGIHHHRIDYSDKLSLVSGRERNGGSDRKQAKPARHQDRKDSSSGTGRLRRLGLS